MTTYTESDLLELIPKLEAVLREFGYANRVVDAGDRFVFVGNGYSDRPVPEAVAWTAYKRVYPTMACWSCWGLGGVNSMLCRQGQCANPEGLQEPPAASLRLGPGF